MKRCQTCGRQHSYSYASECMACYSRRRRTDPVHAERDREHSRAWKAANKDRIREYERERRLSLMTPCEGCGTPCDHDVPVCIDCIRAASSERLDEIVEMYEAGVPLKEMGEVMGCTVNHIGVDLNRLRKKGRVGYRYAGWAKKREIVEPSQ